MRILIRKAIATGRGASEFQDVELQTDTLTIGRGADQLLYLPGSRVALRHARIVQKGQQIVVTAMGAAAIGVNGKEETQAILGEGDSVSIGAHTLKLIRPPTGFALALEVLQSQEDEKQGVAAQSRYETRFGEAGSGKRLLSWMLLLLVAVFGAGLPLADSLSPKAHDVLSEAGYPFSNFWSSGPLSSVHHNSKAVFDCKACHDAPFEAVSNDKCIDCHKHTGNHVHPEHAGFSSSDLMQCGACHEEHNEPEKLVKVGQALCTDCHADIKRLDARSPLDNVMDFQTGHPSFKVDVPVLDATAGEWHTQHIKLADLKADTSNLKFNHKVHMKPEGILTPDGERVMECSDCHQLDDAGWYMKPMTMETTCRSCHALTFDEDDPERQVPHGSPEDVRTELQEYYLNKFTQPRKAEPATAADRRRGRPGHEREASFECRGPAVECATTMTQRTMTELFEKTACYTCHQVSSDAAGQYAVTPVKIVSQWMMGARFTHADHMTEDCSRCHKAAESEVSTDVLIPDIDNCRECHGDPGSWGKLESTCISCHDFHFDDRGVMGRSAILDPTPSETGEQASAETSNTVEEQNPDSALP
jgi:predicted CXXCH cytochrome family protein